MTLRVYGFHQGSCDLSFLKFLPNVRRFAADSLHDAKGFEHLNCLKRLEELAIGVLSLKSFDFLNAISPKALKSLTLCAARSKGLSLRVLERFKGLKQLQLEGHQKDIDAVSTLSKLEDVTFRSLTLKGLDVLRDHRQLRQLSIQLGGTSNLSAIEGFDRMEYLNLWRVRGLKDISVVSTLTGLQYLRLESMSTIRSIPDLRRLKRLRRLQIDKIKTLRNLDAIELAPALEELIFFEADHLEPSDFASALNCNALKRVLVTFRSAAKQSEFKELARRSRVDDRGVDAYSFRFRK